MVRSCLEHIEYIDGETIRCKTHGERPLIQCRGCKDFRLVPQPKRVPTVIHAPVQYAMPEPPECRHLGTKLSIAPCCGQMFACRFHKGKKCAPVGLASEPFLSCETCEDFTLPDSWLSDPERYTGRCVAVTSLSPNPSRKQRQIDCLKSWRAFGMQIIAVNTAAEHAAFGSEIAGIVTQHVSENVTTEYSKPTQRANALLDAGKASGMPFLLINADVELRGDHTPLTDALAMPDRLTIAVRYNYAPGEERRHAQREPAGLDAFLITPEMVTKVPQMPFGIGKPVWDYWLPHHLRSVGYKFNWINKAILYHENHPIQWSKKEWETGAAWLRKSYGVDVFWDVVGFRENLNGA